MEQLLDDIQLQKDNFKKVIDYAVFLLDNARKTKEQLNAQININSIIEENQNQMKEEVGCMREDWKREQMLVIQLGNDIELKETQIQEAYEEKTTFKA